MVAGNAYVEGVALDGQLRELHALRPDRMKVVPGPEGWPEAYEYTAQGVTIRFAEEIVPRVRPILHVRLFHPVNDHYGMSPIEAASIAIDTHNTAAQWNKALLDNSARPSGALVYGGSDGRMTTEQFDRLRSELETSFQGAKQAGRPLLLEGGLDWKPLSLSPKDMDFYEARMVSNEPASGRTPPARTHWRWACRRCCSASPATTRIRTIKKPTARCGATRFCRSSSFDACLWQDRTAKALSAWLSPAYGTELALRADLDGIEALSSEREALWARIERASFLTIDEKRAATGYGPMPGDTLGAGEGASNAPQNFTPSATENAGPIVFHKYRPNQARAPRGSADGGQWVDEGGGGSGSSGNSSSLRAAIRSEFGSDTLGETDASPESVRLAQAGGNYGIDVSEEDRLYGAHTYERHVGKSDEYLQARILQSRTNVPFIGGWGRKRAGSFTSIESANKLVNATLSRPDNAAKLEGFVELPILYPLPDLFLYGDFEAPTGYEGTIYLTEHTS